MISTGNIGARWIWGIFPSLEWDLWPTANLHACLDADRIAKNIGRRIMDRKGNAELIAEIRAATFESLSSYDQMRVICKKKG